MTHHLADARQLLQQQNGGDEASRLRRARRILIDHDLPTDDVVRLGLESALLALAQVLEATHYAEAANHSRRLADGFKPIVISQPAHVAELNRWVYPRSLRWYQAQILDSQGCTVLLHAECYGIRGCRADEDRNHLLLEREHDRTLWWWSSSECSEGYQLYENVLQPAEAEAELRFGLTRHGPVVRAGNSNFAHFIWNELDALLRVVATNRQMDLVQDSNTVLDLATLENIQRVSAAQLAARASIRLGGTLVTNHARDVVLKALRRSIDVQLPRDRPQPLILIGVRGPGRRELRNEVEFIVSLIQALSSHFHHPLILLDGLTYQHNNQDHPDTKRRNQACTARIDEIIQACRQCQLENLSGLSFAHWLKRCEGLRYYVTHEGTMHHKLGWLRPEIPSLCLVGSAHARAIAQWHRLQCEEAGRIATLPVSLFQQETLAEGQPESETRNQPFEIVDIAKAVRLTMQAIRSELEIEDSSSEQTADRE